MKTTLSLSFAQIQALYAYLLEIMSRSRELSGKSLYIKLQLEILGELLEKKIHPKCLIRKNKPIKLELKPYQVLALQISIMQGWVSFMDDFYQQNAVRMISIEQLPQIAVRDEGQIVAPDVWD